ncbi:AlpA family phage regulatory protein [Providencia rettgeri]|nr:AlpA family phage regulatory protein [Providencia rettgeri]
MKNQMVILRVKDVISRLKIGKSTLYDWLNRKSPRFKGDFPRPVKIRKQWLVGLKMK